MSAVHKQLTYDPVKDLTPVALFAVTPFVLVVNPSLPVKSIADLAALAKVEARRPELCFERAGRRRASVRRAAQDHAQHRDDARAVQGQRAGIERRAGRPRLADVRRPVRSMQLVRQGRLRALGVTTAQRMPMAPELAPLAEQGLAGYDAAILAHVRRAVGDAARDRRQAQRRDARHRHGPDRRGGVGEAWRVAQSSAPPPSLRRS